MQKRIICLAVAISLIMSSLVGRIGYIIFSNNYVVGKNYNSYSVKIENVPPNIYYSNGNKINNNQSNYVAVIRPNEKCLAQLHLLFDEKECKQITKELSKGYPLVMPVKYKMSTQDIKIYKTTSTNTNCNQLISKNSTGLLSYLKPYVSSKSIVFSIDARGRLLQGDDGREENNNPNSSEGLQLYIDENIQNITYNACSNLKTGCAIVMDANNSQILAVVNKPDDCYINKAFTQYSVGSVFKIIVATSAIENGIDITYNCTSTTTVGDTTFSCQHQKAHGTENIKQGLANSCNCYFVNLALKLGSEKILATANKLGFNMQTVLYKDWIINNANMPNNDDLSQLGQLALLGFGQGKLTSTPLQICNSLCAVANGGNFNTPKLVKNTVSKDNTKIPINYIDSQKVINDSTSKLMMNYLQYVVTNGTGFNAQSNDKKSAGKTATAQTGQYKNNKEVLNTWFAGVYPYDNPKYVIVVMDDNGVSGSENCCPIFKTIVDKLP